MEEIRSYRYLSTVAQLHKMAPKEIADKLKTEDTPEGSSEYRSWCNSIPLLVDALHKAGLDQLTLVLECSTPIKGRMDAVLLGADKNKGYPLALIIELKQWSSIEPAETQNDSVVYVSQCGVRVHPVLQMQTYNKYLENHHSSFLSDNSTGKLYLRQCIFLHNFEDKQQLFEGCYGVYSDYKRRTYDRTEIKRLITYLSNQFSPTACPKAVEYFLDGSYVLGKVGFDALKKVLNNKRNAQMVDDQYEVNEKIAQILDDLKTTGKKLIVISGQPGTGKTVLGMHIIYEYCRRYGAMGDNAGKCVFALPSSRTLQEIIEKEAFRPVSLDNISDGTHKDVVVIDEAHRIEKLNKRLDNIFQHTKIVIVLQDDHQRIRFNEEGSVENFRNYAERHPEIELQEYSLTTQKRSGYLSNYLFCLDQLLYGRCDQKLDRKGSLKVTCWNSPFALDAHLHQLYQNGHHVKWYAAYCWPWPLPSMRTQDEIIISLQEGLFCKRWNPNFGEHHSWYLAQEEDRLDQVGCIYTAQGLEYDDIGLIWYDDLRWDPNAHKWVFDLNACRDKVFVRAVVEHYHGKLGNYDSQGWCVMHNGVRKTLQQFLQDTGAAEDPAITELFLNIYRVLLTRARESVHIWFSDEATANHVKKVLNLSSR